MGPLQLLLDGHFLELFAILLVLVIAITIHEFGHAFAADVQGDRTARLAGRLTLNPLSHLDPLGSVLLVLA
ncbi:MAG TPA: site-2 protease family protein, partial [Actinomycetota bacterium]|nr:site-2 protease family protein [Actinomycetota bacterium]